MLPIIGAYFIARTSGCGAAVNVVKCGFRSGPNLMNAPAAYVSIRQNMSAYVSIRQHTSACVSHCSVRAFLRAYGRCCTCCTCSCLLRAQGACFTCESVPI